MKKWLSRSPEELPSHFCLIMKLNVETSAEPHKKGREEAHLFTKARVGVDRKLA